MTGEISIAMFLQIQSDIYISLYTLFKNPFINIKKEKNNNNNKHIVFFCFLQTSWAQHSQTVLKISLQQLIEATRQRQ